MQTRRSFFTTFFVALVLPIESQARGSRRGGGGSHRSGGGYSGGGGNSSGCGSRGGAGYRKANGKCAGRNE